MTHTSNSTHNKNGDLVQELNALTNQFFLGTKGNTPVLPHAFSPVLSGVPAEQHALFALALHAQATALVVRPTPTDQTGLPATPTPLAPLPTPDLPVLDISLHSLAKRLAKDHGQALLALTAYKGVLLPAPIALPLLQKLDSQNFNKVPSAYQAWYDWATDPVNYVGDTVFDADDWEKWNIHHKVAFIKHERKNHSPTLLDFLKERFEKLSADDALECFNALVPTLSKNDIAFLQELYQKPQSKQLTDRLVQALARLGISYNDKDGEFDEFFSTYEIKDNELIPLNIKSPDYSRHDKRAKLLKHANLPRMAEHFKMSLPEFVKLWSYRENGHNENDGFFTNMNLYADDETFNAHLESWLNKRVIPSDPQETLMHGRSFGSNYNFVDRHKDRLSIEQFQKIYNLLYRYTYFFINPEYEYFNVPFSLSLEEFKSTIYYQAIVEDIEKNTEQNLDLESDRETLPQIGLLLPFDCAKHLYQMLIEAGANKYDEALWGLEFNIKLNALLNKQDNK